MSTEEPTSKTIAELKAEYDAFTPVERDFADVAVATVDSFAAAMQDVIDRMRVSMVAALDRPDLLWEQKHRLEGGTTVLETIETYVRTIRDATRQASGK